MRAKALICLVWLMAVEASAQTDAILLPPWQQVMLDNSGRIYLAGSDGQLIRQTGEDASTRLVYSPVKKARISLVDVSNPLRTFLFYEDLQEYVILDRFMTETSRYSLVPFTSYAGMVAPSLNNQIWLVDMVDFSIKKIDPQWEQVTIRTPLRQILNPDESEFIYMREYQNLLFLVDRHSGIYLFDNLGNFLRQIEVSGIHYVHFQDKQLYYQKEGEDQRLYTEDIYKGTRETITLPNAARNVWLTDKGMWLFSENKAVLVER